MRAPIRLCLQASCLSLLLGSAAGCAKEVKAEFPRPPATASLPVSDDAPEELPTTPVPEEPVVTEPVESATENEEEPEEPPQVAPPPREPAPSAEQTPPVEPPSTTLAGSTEVDPELASKLERASSLLRSISRRILTPVQAEQVIAARGFVAQARQALAEGDPRRALVLIDKGLILAEDVDRLSRP
jgi:hypothetical protein